MAPEAFVVTEEGPRVRMTPDHPYADDSRAGTGPWGASAEFRAEGRRP